MVPKYSYCIPDQFEAGRVLDHTNYNYVFFCDSLRYCKMKKFECDNVVCISTVQGRM